ncbi:MAG: isoprenylcysteine carboxylmethyltransferase family protein [Candidatus Bathyarchaeota archaeon]|nr:isoprenylcysteine carboxylmethyltransferase family protein [Candidatus Bathyarchaeota archaeon]
MFATILIADLILLFGVVISIIFPKYRIWPPPKKDSWQFWVSWIFSAIGMVGSPLVGILDFATLGHGHWIRFLLGGVGLLIGAGIAVWGTMTLSAHQSLGLKGKLVAEGPYQYSRNPQYAGFILMYAGIILLTYSFMALVTGAFIISVFAILPFSEEPWLTQQYGITYVEYCKQVPRFIGLRSFKPKMARQLT